MKAVSGGAKMVREGDCGTRDWETSSRVRAIETKPESERISAASRTAWLGREEERERSERRMRETSSGAAIDRGYGELQESKEVFFFE